MRGLKRGGKKPRGNEPRHEDASAGAGNEAGKSDSQPALTCRASAKTRTLTVPGRREDADRRLVELLRQRDTGSSIDPSKTTLGEYLRVWLEEFQVSGRTRSATRTRQASGYPHLGSAILQQRAATPSSAGTRRCASAAAPRAGRARRPHRAAGASHARRGALKHGLELGLVASNVAAQISQPNVLGKADGKILRDAEVKHVLARLAEVEHELDPVVDVALSTGTCRGELLALRLTDVDAARGAIRSSAPSRSPPAGP